jgi:parvulin-like peptidyl-prolyl isomerase
MRNICYFAALLCSCCVASAQQQLVNGVNAIVNDSVITFDQVESEISGMAETLAAEYRDDRPGFDKRLQQLRSDKIEELIAEQLILEDFKNSGFMLPDSFIEDAVQDRIRRDYYGDRARFTKTLQARGMTVEMYRKREREHIIVMEMRLERASTKKVLISPAKISTYYNEHQNDFKVSDQVHLRMISVPQPPNAEPGRAKRMAEEILRSIDEGVPFAEMASVYATENQRVEAGDRGWVDRSFLKPELANAAFSLKAGQHSKVIELDEACYLLQVEEVRKAHVRTIEEVRGEIEKTLRAAEQKRLEKKWVDRLRAKAFVRYF